MRSHALDVRDATSDGAHGSLGELDTRGFVVVRSFLSEQEADELARDYEEVDRQVAALGMARHESTRRDDAIDAPYKIRHVTQAARDRVMPKLSGVLERVAAETSIRANTIAPGSFSSVYFATDGDLGLGWHQDSVSYYACQNSHDYLNFYVPVRKPRRDKSNLCVVPFDVLAARSPDVYRALLGKGASRFVAKGGKTIVYERDLGTKLGVLPYALDEIGVTPELARGDLLLLRGDVIHRTQDTDTQRIAVSIRTTDRNTTVSRQALLRGGFVKTVLMTEMRGEFKRLLDCFDHAKRDELTVGEIAALADHHEAPEAPLSTARFLRFLLLNRLAVRLRELA